MSKRIKAGLVAVAAVAAIVLPTATAEANEWHYFGAYATWSDCQNAASWYIAHNQMTTPYECDYLYPGWGLYGVLTN